jgi:AsmA family protein
VSKRRGWILGTLGAVALLLLVVLVLFDWNWLKGPIESQVSGRLGRPFQINGDLDVQLSLQPTITVDGAELGNAPWGSETPMAKIARAEVTVDLGELLHGEVVLPKVRIAQPSVLLETRPEGSPNWQFREAEEPSKGPPAPPRIGRLEVSDASVRYHDLGSRRNIAGELSRIAGRTDPDLKLNATGKVQGQPLAIDITAPAPAHAERGPNAPHAIEARIKAGQTRIMASGNISKPAQLQGVEIAFELTSPGLAELLHAFGVEAAPLPPIQVAGKVVRNQQVWQLNDASAQVGESNLAGRVSLDLSAPRPVVSADLESDRLRAQDLRTAPLEPPQPAGGDGTLEAANTQPKNSSEGSAPLLTAAGINFDALPKVDANVNFRGSNLEALEVRLAQLELDLKLRNRVAVIAGAGTATFRERLPVTFEVHAGTEDNLKNPASRYPLDVSLSAGESHATARGTVDRPLKYTGLDVDVDLTLQGPDLEKLGELLKLPLPGTPPYKLAGKITHQEEKKRWNFVALRGTVGDSDIQGDVSLELSAERPTVVADLNSKALDLDDLGVLVGAPPGTGPGETASKEQKQKAAHEAAAKAPVLPDKQFHVPDLHAFDARISFTGDTVQAMKLPLEHMLAKVTLQDGHIRIDPARLGVAGGKLEARMGLDARNGVLDGDFDLALRNVKLNQLLAAFKVDVGAIQMEKEVVGTFGGQAKLTIKGNSIREMAAAADGEVAVIMGGGQINSLIIEALGLDLGEVLGVLATGDEEKEKGMVPVQCLVSRLDVQNGIMATRALVLETSDSTLTGSGTIDLGQETLDLTLLAHSKDASVLTASTPVAIKGTFREPQIDVISEELEEKGLAALALGIVLPVIGAIFPFIETGEAEGVNCAALMKSAEPAGDVGQKPPTVSERHGDSQ